MSAEYLRLVSEDGQSANPLLGFLGIRLERAEAGEAVMRLPFRRELVQGAGSVAGGILSLLLDECMAHAVLTGLSAGKRIVTADLHVRFLEGVRSQNLMVTATVVRWGKRVIVAEGRVELPDGALAATGTASFLVV